MAENLQITTTAAEVTVIGGVSALDLGPETWVGEKLAEETVKDLVSMVWGFSGPERENLHRWSQGSTFNRENDLL
jgi:hypothetical protein